MVGASYGFADQFVDGLDRVAVVPFGSHNVETGVTRALFHTSRSELHEVIAGIATPERAANTGLFTAIEAALLRLE